MRYKTLLFDLDDTLLCFRSAETSAFRQTFLPHVTGPKIENIFPRYKTIAQELWDQFERNEVTREFVRFERFRRLIEEFEINSATPAGLSAEYLENLTKYIEYVPNAVEICQKYYPLAEIIVITNGFKEVSVRRINNSALKPYIKHIVTSDCAGAPKPDPRIFNHAFSLAKDFELRRTLIIGDTLKADILGANRMNLDSVWYNPFKKEIDIEAKPTYQIGDLSELHQILDS